MDVQTHRDPFRSRLPWTAFPTGEIGYSMTYLYDSATTHSVFISDIVKKPLLCRVTPSLIRVRVGGSPVDDDRYAVGND